MMLKSDFREGFIFGPISFEIIENAYVANSMLRICDFHVILAEPIFKSLLEIRASKDYSD